MKIRLTISVIVRAALLTLLISGAAGAQMKINGGNPLLVISSGIAGGGLVPVTNTTCLLQWTKESVVTKITVSNSCPGQHFELRVAAINVNHGIPAPEVTLTASLSGVDFITNIPPGNPNKKNATLQYTASATFDQGNSDELGIDQNQVTYTVVAQ